MNPDRLLMGINPDKLYFTADTHFGHKAMVERFRTGWGFADIDEMDEYLIRAWNNTVPEDGHIIHLGDMSFRPNSQTQNILNRLNGHKYLVEGNHDKGLSAYCRDMFEWVKPYYEMKIEGNRIVMCHFPFRSWHQMGYGAWNFHGHSHGNLPDNGGKQVDVGVDCWSLAPVSYHTLKTIMLNRPIFAEDHHHG